MAGAGEADGAREHGCGLVVAEARIGQRGSADEGLTVVGLGEIARGDRQGRRGHGQRRRVRDVLREDIVTRGRSEAGDIDAILPHPARGGGVGREDEGAGGGGREGLAVLETGHGRGEGRIGRAVFARSRRGGDGQGRRGDGESTVHATGEDVIVRGIGAGVRDERVGADRAGRRGRGGRATDARDAGGGQGLAVHEAGERGGEGRIGVTVESGRVLGDHGQRRLVNGQRARGVGEDVIAAGESGKRERVGARVDRALGRAAVSQRTAEIGGVFAVLEAGEGHPVAARESEPVVDLARGERGHGEALRGDDAVGGGVQRVDEVVRRFGAREREAAERIVLASTGAREHEFARAAGDDGVTGQNAAEHEVGGRQHPGAVIGLARRGGELPGRDRLVAHEDRRAREITAGLAEARSRQGIVPHGQGSARRERAGGTEREGHAAAETIVVSVGRTARAADGERGQDVARGGQILDAADRVGRRRAVGRGGIGHLNEELARRDDGVIAGDVVHRVVGRGQAAGRKHARIGAGRAGRRVAAGDGQRAAKAGGDVGLAGHEAGEVRAIEADRIGLADETSIGIGGDGQRSPRDRGRDRRHRREQVVGSIRADEQRAREGYLVRRGDILGIIKADGRSADADDIAAEDAGKHARARDGRRRGAVVDLGGRDGEAADGERPRGDGGRDGRGHRQRVVSGGRAGQGQAGEADGDRRGDVLAVIDAHRSTAQGDRIATEDATEGAGAGDDRARGAVVDLARRHTETGDGQRLRRDGRRDDVVGGDRVIAGGGAAEGEAGEAHAGRGGDVLAVVETLGEAVERDRVAGDDAREGAVTGDVGRDGTVVDLAGRDAEVAQGERTRGDGAAEVAGRDHVVAADAAVGTVRDGIADAHGLAGADVDVGEATDAGDDDGLRADEARERARLN